MALSMRPSISVVTPTCRRPTGLALATRWLQAQTIAPDEWIIANDSTEPPGPYNFLDNLERGVARARGDLIVFWEDDDYYAPTHLAALLDLFSVVPDGLLFGDDMQRYYNLPYRRYKVMANQGASLCQTAMHRMLLPWFHDVIVSCRGIVHKAPYGVDGRLWGPVLRGDLRGALAPLDTVVGIKGLPGTMGLGLGHRPERVAMWEDDAAGEQLRRWITDPAAVATYEALFPTAEPVQW